MKLYFRNSGSGSLLIRVGAQKFILKSGINTVPDDVGEEILKKNIKGISTDEEAQSAKSEKVAALNDVAALKSEMAKKDAQIAKLQLIAAQVPVSDEVKDAQIAALTARIAELEAKPKRGRPPVIETTPEVPAATE